MADNKTGSLERSKLALARCKGRGGGGGRRETASTCERGQMIFAINGRPGYLRSSPAMTLMHDVCDVESSPVAGLFTESNERRGTHRGPPHRGNEGTTCNGGRGEFVK